MKNNRTHLTRLAAISLVVVMCLSALPMLAPSASAEPVAVSNERIGDMVVFEQDYTQLFVVPENIFYSKLSVPQTPINLDLSYNYTDSCIDMRTTTGGNGQFFIGGLTPMVKTNFTIDMSISRDNWNNYVELCSPHAYYILQVMLNDTLCIRAYSYVGDTSTITGTLYVPSIGSNAFNVKISYDGVNKTNTLYINGGSGLTTALYVKASWDISAHNYFSTNGISFKVVTDPSMLWTTLKIYRLTQTAPRYDYVTPLGDPNKQPWGLDGPHPYEHIDDGIQYVVGKGGTGTIWVDTHDFSSYSDQNKSNIIALINSGWELGIHYSTQLASLSMAEAIALMDSEYAEVVSIFGQHPTSFCSLANADNASHAEYAYVNLNMVSRNMALGVGGFSNIGNLYDAVWPWWENASAAGFVYPMFTHRLDQSPASIYSISLEYWQEMCDNYNLSGMHLTGYYEFWALAQNTYSATISGLTLENDTSMSFTVDNIGGKSRLFVAAPWTEIVVDGDGNEVPFEAVDDGIIIEVETGEYQVMTMSAYRADQIDRAISPLYTVIPVVIVLAVMGGLFAMVGRIKI